MLFKIALYGSFKNTPGYTWVNPDGLDTSPFGRIPGKPTDGRRIQDDEVRGGYFIDAAKDVFYAFRFINGGSDALGREGVVITNWITVPFSEIRGFNIRPLYDHLRLKELPRDIGGIDISLSSKNASSHSEVSSNQNTEENFFSVLSPLEKTGAVQGTTVDALFDIPVSVRRGNPLVMFDLKGNDRTAEVKIIETVPHKQPFRLSPRTPSTSEKKQIDKTVDFDAIQKSIAGIAKKLLLISLTIIIVVCIISLFPEKSHSPSSKRQKDPGRTVQNTSTESATTEHAGTEKESKKKTVYKFAMTFYYDKSYQWSKNPVNSSFATILNQEDYLLISFNDGYYFGQNNGSSLDLMKDQKKVGSIEQTSNSITIRLHEESLPDQEEDSSIRQDRDQAELRNQLQHQDDEATPGKIYFLRDENENHYAELNVKNDSIELKIIEAMPVLPLLQLTREITNE